MRPDPLPNPAAHGRRLRKIAIIALALFASATTFAAGERGTFGFAIEVDGEGFFLNPTLKSVTIVSITVASPAAIAGIAQRDQIVEAEGRVVAGAKARDFEALLKRDVGQSVKLKLRRQGGEEYLVTLVAVPRAAKP